MAEIGGSSSALRDSLLEPADPSAFPNKNADVETLLRWRKPIFTLNAARRFRYAADLKRREDELALIEAMKKRRFKVRSLVAQAARNFLAEGEKHRAKSPSPAPARKDKGKAKEGFNVSAEELSKMMQDEDKDALKTLGGVHGIADSLNIDTKDGLPGDETDVGKRKAAFGTNTYPEKKGKPFLTFLWEACQDFTLLILMVCAAISLAVGISTEGIQEGWYDGAGIAMSIILVVLVTATTDYQQSLQFQNLNKEKSKIYVQVTRGGRRQKVLIYDLLVGDVVHLSIGDQVPADGLFIEGHSLTIDESQMTGESEPVKKGEQDQFLLSGCKVSDGGGTMMIVAVGMNTEWGRLMSTLSSDDTEETPLQVRLNGVATMVGKMGLTVAVLVFVILISKFLWAKWDTIGQWTGKDTITIVNFFAIAVTIIVVSVPEGLPLAVTLTLAFAMHKMMSQKALVRHLSACETMGSATTICSDKTGTLTMNQMSVVKAWVAGSILENAKKVGDVLNKDLLNVLKEGICQNTSGDVFIPERGDKPEIIGSPTEAALLGFAMELGADFKGVRSASKIIAMEPFSSAKKCMGVQVEAGEGQPRIHWKGASEIVLGMCDSWVDSKGKITALTEDKKEELKHEIEKMARQSLRTLCLAYREVSASQKGSSGGGPKPEEQKVPNDKLICLAIVGIKDPCRPGVPEAVRLCQKAGIIVRMVTGDNVTTARAIAEECGILAEGGEAIEGPKFRALSDSEARALVPKLRVMARSSPTDKNKLVRLLQESGEVVAATGDGTNDAPALHQADIGLAMGIAGTEVAKESADVVILDDNFTSIVNVAKWGRSVYANIQKFVQFQLTVNIVALALNFISAVVTGSAPLTAVQLLWVNLIMDTLGALALATDPPTNDLMKREPVGRTAPLITGTMWRNIIGMALYQLVVLLVLQFHGKSLLQLEGPDREAVLLTLIFNSFVFCQVFNEVNSREVEHVNVFRNVFNNPVFLLVIAVTVVFQVIMVEFLGHFAATVPLNLRQWAICIGIGALSMPIAAIIKLIPVADESSVMRIRGKRSPQKSESKSGYQQLPPAGEDGHDVEAASRG